MRLDEIGPEEIERYKALKQEEEQQPRSINNHLIALRKLLSLAVEYKKLSHVPKFKALKFGEEDFEFLDFEALDQRGRRFCSRFRRHAADSVHLLRDQSGSSLLSRLSSEQGLFG